MLSKNVEEELKKTKKKKMNTNIHCLSQNYDYESKKHNANI